MNKKISDIDNVTVGIVILDKGLKRVILKQRDEVSIFSDKYGIPGGKVKINESMQSAAKRELYEEHQLNVDQLFFVKSYKYNNIYLFVYCAILDEDNEYFVLLEDIEGLDLAPNINDAISESIEFFKDGLHTQDVNLHILKTDIIRCISDNVIRINDQIGWDHFLLQRRIGIIGTAVGLEILNYSDNDKLKGAVCETLLQSQLPDGGWGVKSSDNKFAVTGSTCNCISAIYGFTHRLDHAILNGLDWIKANRLNDGLWGYNKSSQQGRISTTCIVINTLHRLGFDYYKNDIINCILKYQNKDGGWGFVANAPSNLSVTCLVVLTLAPYRTIAEGQIKNAVFWIEDRLRADLIVDESEIEYIGDKRYEYKHSTKIYILQALLSYKGIENISPSYLYQ